MDHMSLCISENETVRTAMDRLNCASMKILFVTDAAGRLSETLTDGDIRRYLLANGTLDAAVSKAGNAHPIFGRSMDEARELLQERGCIAVPVVDGDGKITDIATDHGHTSKKQVSLGLPVVIMAGGKGTRLEPYTKILPKPLIPVGDLPIMEHIMRRFQQYGCTEFHGIVNYKKQLIKAYFS